MKARSALALALFAAACAPSYPINPAPSATPAPRAPAPAPEPVAPPPSAPRSPVPRPSDKDQCGAADLQRLIGHPRTEIPVPLDPNRQRVACMGCPITLDSNPARLNFFFERETGIIKEIRCG